MPLDAELGWRERRRRNIIEAAHCLFGSAAFDAVQMDDIARRAGISKPTLYRYFNSKDELILEVLNEGLADLEAQTAAVLGRDISPQDALQELIRAMIDSLSRQIASLRLMTEHRSALADRWRTLFRQRRHPLVAALRTAMERGVASGDFRPLDLDVLPALVVGMIRGGLMGVGHLPNDRLATAAISLVLGAVVRGESEAVGTALPRPAFSAA